MEEQSFQIIIRKKSRTIRLILISLAALILISCGIMAVYISNYYHADEAAAEAMEGNERVIVSYGENDMVIFCPVDREELLQEGEDGDSSGEVGDEELTEAGTGAEDSSGEAGDEELTEAGTDAEDSSGEAGDEELTEAGALAEVSQSQIPGLIFYPGARVEYTAYAPLLLRLAEQGIFCVVVKMPLNMAFMDMDAAAYVQESFPEIGTWILAGHSLGGAMGAMYLQNHWEDFEGLVFLGSFSSVDLSGTDLRVLDILAEQDGVLNLESWKKGQEFLPKDTRTETISGGCHAYFGSYGPQAGDGTPSITPREQWDETAELITEWVFEE